MQQGNTTGRGGAHGEEVTCRIERECCVISIGVIFGSLLIVFGLISLEWAVWPWSLVYK